MTLFVGSQSFISLPTFMFVSAVVSELRESNQNKKEAIPVYTVLPYCEFDRCQDTVMFLPASFSSSHSNISRDIHDALELAGSQASQNDRESVVLLKLLNTISVAPSNIQLVMLSSIILTEGDHQRYGHRWCL